MKPDISQHPEDHHALERAAAAMSRISAAAERLANRHQGLRDAATSVVAELDRMINHG